MDVEIAHKAQGKNRFHKVLAILVGLAAIVAALLATLDAMKERSAAPA